MTTEWVSLRLEVLDEPRNQVRRIISKQVYISARGLVWDMTMEVGDRAKFPVLPIINETIYDEI